MHPDPGQRRRPRAAGTTPCLATAGCSLAGAFIVLLTRDRSITVPGLTRRRLEVA
jgi:hypothetical protein